MPKDKPKDLGNAKPVARNLSTKKFAKKSERTEAKAGRLSQQKRTTRATTTPVTKSKSTKPPRDSKPSRAKVPSQYSTEFLLRALDETNETGKIIKANGEKIKKLHQEVARLRAGRVATTHAVRNDTVDGGVDLEDQAALREEVAVLRKEISFLRCLLAIVSFVAIVALFLSVVAVKGVHSD